MKATWPKIPSTIQGVRTAGEARKRLHELYNSDANESANWRKRKLEGAPLVMMEEAYLRAVIAADDLDREVTKHGDEQNFEDISTTTPPFALYGGRYVITVDASSWPANALVTLVNKREGWAWGPAAPAFTDDGSQTLDLGPGSYRFMIDGAIKVYARIEHAAA